MPLAVTDNLNFGNPYKPENFWQLREAVEGLAEACRAFDTPVIGGNVSLYNESPAGVVDPTPTVAMVGLIEREEWITTQYFKAAGDVVILLGDFGDELGALAFPESDPRPQRSGCRRGSISSANSRCTMSLRELIRAGLVRSAHDCSEGGCRGAGGGLFQSRRAARRGDRSGRGRRIAARSNPFQRIAVARCHLYCARERRRGDADVAGAWRARASPRDGRWRHARPRAAGEALRWPLAEIYDDWFNAIARVVGEA